MDWTGPEGEVEKEIYNESGCLLDGTEFVVRVRVVPPAVRCGNALLNARLEAGLAKQNPLSEQEGRSSEPPKGE